MHSGANGFLADMHLRRCETFRRARVEEPWETVVPRELGEAERLAILRVCARVERAGLGRTEAMQALRGGRSEKLRRSGLAEGDGHGALARCEEAEVLARIDTLVREGMLAAERLEGGGVRLALTPAGLHALAGDDGA